ncbi:coagulation factor X-like [Toxorhynchites rutilus septentrionalis]|uniref:coagulation factor X-like n=1 Tax=Toxorhynchites rutilus septentrionalis TaxID=329112 RepID=UPI002479F5A4|nr:coagulation factor X-like [Toxorhynchites rutilus septentrionalis]
MVYGLSYLGRECGFGEHSIAIGVASHAEWMKSVLFPNYRKSQDTMQFIDPDFQEGDSCNRADGRAARCVSVSMCSRGWNRFLLEGTIQLCATSSLVCCPLNDIVDGETSFTHPQLVRCPNLVENLRPKSPSGSLVFVGRIISNTLEIRCLGTIIAEQIILTSASCAGDDKPTTVQPVVNTTTTQKIYRVEAVLVHHAYNATDGTNDIALIRLKETFVWGSNLFPSCLWMNATHVPLLLSLISPINEKTLHVSSNEDRYFHVGTEFERILNASALAMFNSDCQRTHMYDIQDTQLCARDRIRNFTCDTVSDQLRYDRANGVSYLVGLSTNFAHCQHSYYKMFTRISSFVSWIGRNI